MSPAKLKRKSRIKRKLRIRKKILGTMQRPRLSVYRSLRHMYAQLIDDTQQRTILGVSTLSKAFREKTSKTGNIEAAKVLGEILAQKALEKHITRVAFDRNGFLYHGRVKALAESAREKGLVF